MLLALLAGCLPLVGVWRSTSPDDAPESVEAVLRADAHGAGISAMRMWSTSRGIELRGRLPGGATVDVPETGGGLQVAPVLTAEAVAWVAAHPSPPDGAVIRDGTPCASPEKLASWLGASPTEHGHWLPKADAEPDGLVCGVLVGEEGLPPGAVVDAMVSPEPGREAVLVRLSEPGRAAFEALTRAHVREFVAIIVDGRVVMAPRVNEAITGRDVRIDMGHATRTSWEDACHLAAQLLASRLHGRLERVR
jgi:hypothetical protein